MKALVIENEPSNLEILEMTLQLGGFDVHAYNSGSDFLAKVRALKPLVILLDIDLGEYDGRELCRQLKGTVDLQQIPVIIISAASSTKLESAKSYGADITISKPFDIDVLILAIKNLI